jgi:hypothetical protein
LVFDVRVDNNNQCLSSYGLLLDASAQCTTTGFGSADQTLLSVTLAAFYQGGSAAVASWTYRGADLTCDEMARAPADYDALLVSQTFDLMIGAPVMATLTMVGAAPLPLSASHIECPLLMLPCACVTGCAYAADVWSRNNDQQVWARSQLPDTICGLPPVDWLAATRSTRSFPVKVGDVIVEWIAATLNTANFHCATTAVMGDAGADTAVRNAWSTVHTTLVQTAQASIDCLADTHDWSAETAVLRRYNTGGYANMSGPCSCSERECAARYDDDVNAAAPFIDATAFNDANPAPAQSANPADWDTLTIVFFSVMLALGCVVIVLAIFIIGQCLCAIGPRGFRRMGDEMPDCGVTSSAAAAPSYAFENVHHISR